MMKKESNENKFNLFKVFALAGTAVSILIVIAMLFSGFTRVDAGEIVVYQSFSGKMEVWSTPGWKLSVFGSTTVYQKSDEFEFSATKRENGQADTARCTRTRFNDKGSALICGQASFDLPTDHAKMLTLHEKFRSMEGIKDRIVKTALTKGIYNSGTLMSSKESAGGRRSELISFIQEQAVLGVYKTVAIEKKVDDLNAPPIEEVQMQKVPVLDEDGEPKLDEDGNPMFQAKAVKVKKLRQKVIKVREPVVNNGKIEVQEESTATKFGLSLYNITVEAIVYDPKVQEQIDKQRNLEMEIQTSIAKAETAKQDAITAEQAGRAEAQKAKWTQEVKKAQAVTAAEQAREVAKLALEEERLKAEAVLVKAKADAEAKKMRIKADGALDKKLEAWKFQQAKLAEALGSHRLTPDVSIGSNGKGNTPDGIALMMQAMGVSAAKQLQLDMKVEK